ncbi:hypothetical protein [Spirosoma sp. KNUC1025]|uniref:hypothetical protein n=1 Tax=Spirosoma sp. KNUC1025 TaxID=2894082 RepID=UPI00386CD01D|nr:hypothetical protein LN737_13975 [Spirosoma sp. KNUC1025]
MKSLTQLLPVLCFGLPALVFWSCADHEPQPTPDQLLTGCTVGWSTTSQTAQGSFIGGLAPRCYRLVFGQDGKLTVDRSRCTGVDTAPLSLGNWAVSSITITLPSRTWNIYGIPGPHRLDELTSTTLRFSYRGDPDRIEETWSCR